MSGMLMSLVGKKILAESARNHFGQEDPYFEEVPASRLHRAFGKKTQKKRKAIPHGLSENDRKVLTQVKRRAYRLDYSLCNFCGIRFGWGSVIGLIPFIGDVGDTVLGMMVVRSCESIDGGLPARLRMMMMINVIIDFAIGLVPFVGDIADAAFKGNTRNAIILEKYLREKGAKEQRRRQDAGVDMSLPEEFDKYDGGQLGDSPNDGSHKDGGPAKPQAAKHPQSNRHKNRSLGGPKNRADDLETGIVENPEVHRRS